MNREKLARTAAINLASRIGLGILGLTQVILIAGVFGVSATTDAYLVGIWVVLFVWGMGDSVLTYTIVPYLVSVEVTDGSEKVKDARNHLFSWFVVVLSVFAFAIYAGAPYLAYLLVPGFSEEAHRLTVDILRWLSPGILLGGLAALFSSFMYAARKFSVPAVAALIPDIGAIGFIVVSAHYWGIKAVVIGFLSGVCVQLFILSVSLTRLRLMPKFKSPRIDDVKSMAKLLGARVGGVGLNRAVVGVDRFFGSMLETGSVSILAYTYRITQLPVTLAVAAFGKTLMPVLAREVAEGETEKLREFVPRSIGFVIFGLAPVVLILVFYSDTIIGILYGRGAFTPEAASLAADVLILYSMAILFSSVTIIFSGVFYALGDTVTPLKITSFSLLLNAALDFLFMKLFGIKGIALATVCIAIVTMILLYRRLAARIGGIDISLTFNSLVKIGVATAIMGIAIWGAGGMFADYILFENPRAQLVELGGFSLFSWIIFLLVCRFLRLEEYLTITSLLGKRYG